MNHFTFAQNELDSLELDGRLGTVPLHSQKNKTTQPGLMNSIFADGGFRIWCQQHEPIDPTRLVSTVCCCWCEECFLDTLWAAQDQSLVEYCRTPCSSLCGHSLPAARGYFHQDELVWLSPQSKEEDTGSVNVQLTNLQEHDAYSHGSHFPQRTEANGAFTADLCSCEYGRRQIFVLFANKPCKEIISSWKISPRN